MSEFTPRHLVFIRHGESEGDVRRKAISAGLDYPLQKHPKDELQTEKGHLQSKAAGECVLNNIIKQYNIGDFDEYRVSPLRRTVLSAYSTGLSENWINDDLLCERDRGVIQGLTKSQHKNMFPKSYDQMINQPFHWTPPKGESILRVAHRIGNLISTLDTTKNYLFMTHRDVMWACQMPIEHKSLDEMESINTDEIDNGYIMHYTNVNPTSGRANTTSICWKRTINPSLPNQQSDWLPVANP